MKIDIDLNKLSVEELETIVKILQRHGIEPKGEYGVVHRPNRQRHYSWSKKDLLKVWEMYNNKVTTRKIAEKMGLTYRQVNGTIWRIRKATSGRLKEVQQSSKYY